MGGVAIIETGGRFAVTFAEYVLWGSVLAAGLCAAVIGFDLTAELAWIAIGYVLMGGLLTQNSPHLGFVLLALALMPLVPRPRGSLAFGLGVSAVAAIVSRLVLAFAL
jgi:hypothetical protein